MGTTRRRLRLAIALTLVLLGTMAVAQPETATPSVRLLVIDETKTLHATMRIGAMVGALKGAGLFHVDVRLADVESSGDDPLVGERPDPRLDPYDIVLIVPRGMDNASADWVLVVTDTLSTLRPAVLAGVGAIEQVVAAVFEGSVRTVGIYDHLLVPLLYGVYEAQGWMR